MSETTQNTTEQRIFDKLAELGLEIDRSVLRFIELAQLLPLDKQTAAARKCGTLQFGDEQSQLIHSLEQQVKVHGTIIRALHTEINACEKKLYR